MPEVEGERVEMGVVGGALLLREEEGSRGLRLEGRGVRSTWMAEEACTLIDEEDYPPLLIVESERLGLESACRRSAAHLARLRTALLGGATEGVRGRDECGRCVGDGDRDKGLWRRGILGGKRPRQPKKPQKARM